MEKKTRNRPLHGDSRRSFSGLKSLDDVDAERTRKRLETDVPGPNSRRESKPKVDAPSVEAQKPAESKAHSPEQGKRVRKTHRRENTEPAIILAQVVEANEEKEVHVLPKQRASITKSEARVYKAYNEDDFDAIASMYTQWKMAWDKVEPSVSANPIQAAVTSSVADQILFFPIKTTPNGRPGLINVSLASASMQLVSGQRVVGFTPFSAISAVQLDSKNRCQVSLRLKDAQEEMKFLMYDELYPQLVASVLSVVLRNDFIGVFPFFTVKIHEGEVRLRDDNGWTYSKRYLRILNSRLLIYEKKESTFPIHSLYLPGFRFYKQDMIVLKLKSDERKFVFSFESPDSLEHWLRAFKFSMLSARQEEDSIKKALSNPEKDAKDNDVSVISLASACHPSGYVEVKTQDEEPKSAEAQPAKTESDEQQDSFGPEVATTPEPHRSSFSSPQKQHSDTPRPSPRATRRLNRVSSLDRERPEERKHQHKTSISISTSLPALRNTNSADQSTGSARNSPRGSAHNSAKPSPRASLAGSVEVPQEPHLHDNFGDNSGTQDEPFFVENVVEKQPAKIRIKVKNSTTQLAIGFLDVSPHQVLHLTWQDLRKLVSEQLDDEKVPAQYCFIIDGLRVASKQEHFMADLQDGWVRVADLSSRVSTSVKTASPSTSPSSSPSCVPQACESTL